MPRPQSTQTEERSVAANLPFSQLVQVVAATASEKEPLAHSWHTDAEVEGANVPTGQSPHEDERGVEVNLP